MNKKLYISISLILLFCLPVSYFNSFARFENYLQDVFLQSSGKMVDPKIVIVSIDEATLKKFGKWPLPRTYLAEAVNKLKQGKAAVIGIDLVLSEESGNPDEDVAMVKSVHEAGNVILALYGNFGNRRLKSGEMTPVSITEPFESLNKVSKTGHINVIEDSEDGVIRKNLVGITFENRKIKNFDEQIYLEYLKNTGNTVPNEVRIPVDNWNMAHIDYYMGPGEAEHLSLSSVLSNEIPHHYFENKIVLIGLYAPGLGDSYPTPLNHNTPMYGIEIHANIILNYLYGNFKTYSPDWLNITILICLCVLAFFLFKRLKPIKSACIMLAFLVLYPFVIAPILYNLGIVLQIFYPIAIVLCVFLNLLAYFYLVEYLERKRVTSIFGRYVAPEVVKEVLEGGEESLKLGGNLREITCLFVDIRGFTAMSERMQPEAVVDLLNDYLNLTGTSISKYGGTLDKFIGDGTMAIFNAPLDLEDHAFMAVKAAWAMIKGASMFQSKHQIEYDWNIKFGIGINTGKAIIGNIGASFRTDYTAIGDTVNTAARLESNAKPGQVLISQTTYEKIKDKVKATPLGEFKLKGKQKEVLVYQLDGLVDTDE